MWSKIVQTNLYVSALLEIFVTLFLKCKTTNCNLVISNKDLHSKKKKSIGAEGRGCFSYSYYIVCETTVRVNI